MGASFFAYLVMMTVGRSLFLLKIAPQRWSECSSAHPHFLHWRSASIIKAQGVCFWEDAVWPLLISATISRGIQSRERKTSHDSRNRADHVYCR